MRGAVIRCPNCGAVINSPGNIVNCQYCGTQVRVQRRTGFFERVEVPPQLPPTALHLPLIKQAHSAAWKMRTIFIALFIAIGVIVPLVFSVQSRFANIPSIDEPQWSIAPPLMTQIGKQEALIGQLRTIRPNDMVQMAAFSAANGKRIWLGPPLGSYSDSVGAHLSIAETTLLIGIEQHLRGYSKEDGTLLWKTEFSEKIDTFCSGSPGHVIVKTTDDKLFELALESGNFFPNEQADCEPLVLPHHDGSRIENLPRRLTLASRLEFSNFSTNTVIDVIESDGSRIKLALGSKKPGTPVPYVIRFTWPQSQSDFKKIAELRKAITSTDINSHERQALIRKQRKLEAAQRKLKPRETWRTVVPATNPLDARSHSFDTHQVVANAQVIAIIYETKNKLRLTALSLKDGKRLFDVPVPGDWPFSGVEIASEAIVVVRWGHLYAFRLSDGNRTFSL